MTGLDMWMKLARPYERRFWKNVFKEFVKAIMTISNCNGLCVRDADTGEIFCPVCGAWVSECPKESCRQSRSGK